MLAVDEAEGRAIARLLAREEGLFAGTSTGLDVVAARRVAAALTPETAVPTIAVDTGLEYLVGDLVRR